MSRLALLSLCLYAASLALVGVTASAVADQPSNTAVAALALAGALAAAAAGMFIAVTRPTNTRRR